MSTRILLLARSVSSLTRLLTGTLILAMMFPIIATAETAQIAVASNFKSTSDELVALFEARTGHTLIVSTGPSGVLYNQIIRGADYDVFLSADVWLTESLESRGRANPGSSFTYAIGRLALWTNSPHAELYPENPIPSGRDRIAIANPRLAPYGAAAVEYLRNVGVYEAVEPRLVYGESVAQAFSYTLTRNASFGFVSYAQILERPSGERGDSVLLDEADYPPILQNAVPLKRPGSNQAAIDFIEFLQSETARSVIERSGYRLP